MTTETINHLDEAVRTYLELTDKIEQLTVQREVIKTRLREMGAGHYETTYGVTVVVSPQRRFNLDKAWGLLADEQRNLCLAPDAKKVKSQLPAVLADSCMDDAGDPRVVVK